MDISKFIKPLEEDELRAIEKYFTTKPYETIPAKMFLLYGRWRARTGKVIPHIEEKLEESRLSKEKPF